MAVPSSGELKLWDSIWNQEIGGSQGENSLHSASIYADFSTPDAMSDFYGWSDIEVPGVTTSNASSVTNNSMVLNANLGSTGNSSAVYRGFYHGTNANAYSNNTKYTVSGTTASTGAFNYTRSSLSYSTTYYFWAWACNEAGQVVGNRCQSTTNAPPFSPSYSSFVPRAVGSTGVNFYGSGYSRGDAAYRNPYTGGYVTIRSQTQCSPAFQGQPYATNTQNRLRTIGTSYDGYFGPDIYGWLRPGSGTSWGNNFSVTSYGSGASYSLCNNSYCARINTDGGPGSGTIQIFFCQ